MTLMKMMDTIFYLGLVVTFLLILLVVYHFKNRVSTMEQRCDTMFEIMNNIVQELNLLRRNQKMSFDGGEHTSMPPTHAIEHEHNIQMHHANEEDDEEDEYESDEDDSTYSSDDDLEEDDEDDEEEDKVVELDNDKMDDDVLKQVQMVDETVNSEPTQISLLEIDDNNSIKVEKVETTLENTDQLDDFPSTMDAYKAMTNSALKALVIEKGLSTNPSKLKKSELLDLLNELE
jgi:hypothetical protein|uniref:Rho termination factor N-terminal domain-containing protein n=1 Tax=viral metagenome TaxID=1070528 RepID=A0A6C0IR62_9ZZZZ